MDEQGRILDEDSPPFQEPEDFRSDQVQDEDDDDEMVEITLSINRILPGLWIGDYVASQQFDILRQLGITHIIAAMRQKYEAPPDFTLHRVSIEDNNRTNILAHFEVCNDIIHQVLAKDESILVHCQAGVSRSTTLCAAFLMHEYGLTTDEAIEQISSVRSQVQPTEFFLGQLEMYERMEYEVDPAKFPEYRRFLMNFSHEEIMNSDGAPNQLFLAYYPTPASTPRGSRPGSSLSMRSRTGSNASILSTISRRSSSSSMRRPSRSDLFAMTPANAEDTQPRSRNRRLPSGLEMTASASSSRPSMSNQSSASSRDEIRAMLKTHAAEQDGSKSSKSARERAAIQAEAQRLIDGRGILKVGKGRVQVKGRRIRCKMCRRELAAREHIVQHEAGQGQQAFAPRRRDMAQHRSDLQKRRQMESIKPHPQAEQTTPPTEQQAEAAASSTLAEKRQATAMHLPGVDQPANDSAIDDEDSNSPPLLCSPLCNSYFTEPLSWMSDQLEDGSMGGKLLCPSSKCRAKLGAFDWAGLQCSCGSWIVPAFSLSAGKIDEM